MAKPKLKVPEMPELLKLPTQLPQPTGYRLLCAVPEVAEKTEGGIYKTDRDMEIEALLSTVLFVMAKGPDAYADEKRFPSGHWCEVGDFVLVRPHVGSKIKIHGKEFRMIADDAVEAVVDDPRGYSRA